jgi:hypothetical protein
MDYGTLEQNLAAAEMHITEGERHVARQREIVAELANDDGRDLNTALSIAGPVPDHAGPPYC